MDFNPLKVKRGNMQEIAHRNRLWWSVAQDPKQFGTQFSKFDERWKIHNKKFNKQKKDVNLFLIQFPTHTDNNNNTQGGKWAHQVDEKC